MAQLWLVKDEKGRVSGPFSDSEVLRKIALGDIEGTEQICEYPRGQWRLLSKIPAFYEAVLETFSSPQRKSDQASPPGEEEDYETEIFEIEKEAFQEPPLKPKFLNDDVVELQTVEEIKKSKRQKSTRAPLLFLVGGGLALILFSFWQPQPKGELKLLRPNLASTQKNEAGAKIHYSKGIKNFLADTSDGYIAAQNELVQSIEANSSKADSFEFLCMTYKELWSLSQQDREDLETVKWVSERAGRQFPASRASDVCRLVELTVSGLYDEARELAFSVLRAHPDYIFINQIMGEFELAQKKYKTALYYFNQARELWPTSSVWLKPIVDEALVHAQWDQESGSQHLQLAIRTLQGLNQKYPLHATSAHALARIEFEKMRRADRAEKILMDLVRSKITMDRSRKASVYLLLAQVKKAQGEKEAAIQFAQKAYEAFPTQAQTKKFLVELGVPEKMGRASKDSRDLVFTGDQYAKAGNCLAAQSEYRQAFEIDNQNALAAMKASECLWKLNQGDEAIDWLKKSLAADSKLVPAYVRLSDYYSSRYDYMSAVEVLKKAQSVQPKSFEIQRGFALIELRRKNYASAVKFADRALQMFDMDFDTLWIEAESHIEMNDYDKAVSFANRLLELDPNDGRAQRTYAKVLAGVKGYPTALSYIRDKVNRQPTNVDFKVVYAELLTRDEKFSDAELVLKDALQLAPKNKPVLLQLGAVLKTEKKNREALEVYLTAAALDPADVEPMFLTGVLYFDEKQFAKSIKQFDRIEKINKNYPLVRYWRAKSLVLMGDKELALKEIEAEKMVNPKLIDPYLLAADIYKSQEQFSNCSKELQQAVELGGKTASNYVSLAQCFRQSGSMDAALSMLNQAAELESGYADIYKEQGAIFESQSQFDKAAESYGKYLVLAPGASDRSEIENRIKSMPR